MIATEDIRHVLSRPLRKQLDERRAEKYLNKLLNLSIRSVAEMRIPSHKSNSLIGTKFSL